MIIGIDEAGMGPLAGPVVAAAAYFEADKIAENLHKYVFDCKKLTSKKRQEMFPILKENLIHGIGVASSEEIDSLGIRPANHLAMIRAIENLKKNFPQIKIQKLQIDGNYKFVFPHPSEDIIKGDEKIKHISAASIIAKVHRDNLMLEIARQYPQYGFENHKGYGTALHLKLLKEHGPCPAHRKYYEPVKSLLKK